MMPEWLWIILCQVISLVVAVKGSKDTKSVRQIYRIEDFDFENTKVRKACLLAEFNATIRITNDRSNNYVINIPKDAETDGSFCDRNFRSELVLKFDGTIVTMTFMRNTNKPNLLEMKTYCDKCDFGTWNLTHLIVFHPIEHQKFVEASMNPQDLHQYSKDLSKGIEIKRAYKCEMADGASITIPLERIVVIGAQNQSELESEPWKAEIEFQLIQVQPFLVFRDDFDDPYLCSDITVSLLLVILLPLIYFTIFIVFYRCKAKYGCPPMPNKTGRLRLHSDNMSESYVREESTNMASGYSSFQLASDNT